VYFFLRYKTRGEPFYRPENNFWVTFVKVYKVRS